MPVDAMLKRINEYLNHFKLEPSQVELTLEYHPTWEIDGPSIILKPKGCDGK